MGSVADVGGGGCCGAGACPGPAGWGGVGRGPSGPPPTKQHGRAHRDDLREGSGLSMSETVAVLGPGRIGRQIALTFALAGHHVVLVDLKDRSVADSELALADARREIARDVALMVEEQVVPEDEAARGLERIEERIGLGDLGACAFVQEALPESVELKRATFRRLSERISADAIVASTSSTISPTHLAEAVAGPERFLVAHWLNPAHIIPLVEVVPGRQTSAKTVESTLTLLERLGKTPVRCADSPRFIGSRPPVLLLN